MTGMQPGAWGTGPMPPGAQVGTRIGTDRVAEDAPQRRSNPAICGVESTSCDVQFDVFQDP